MPHALKISALPTAWHHRIQVLSWEPGAFVYHKFLSRSEVKHLLELSSPLVCFEMAEGNGPCMLEWCQGTAGVQCQVITLQFQDCDFYIFIQPSALP